MESIYDKSSYDSVMKRLESLPSTATAKWGKMSAAQMLAHCIATYKYAMLDEEKPRMMAGRLMGWMFKKKLYSDDLYKPGLPTSPDFVVKDERNFDKEKAALIAVTKKFHEAGPGGYGKYPHPFFGKFTTDQWGKMMWKHLDHHLRQFGY
jgi:hypothetical protein